MLKVVLSCSALLCRTDAGFMPGFPRRSPALASPVLFSRIRTEVWAWSLVLPAQISMFSGRLISLPIPGKWSSVTMNSLENLSEAGVSPEFKEVTDKGLSPALPSHSPGSGAFSVLNPAGIFLGASSAWVNHFQREAVTAYESPGWISNKTLSKGYQHST